jgi:hypothetical protein
MPAGSWRHLNPRKRACFVGALDWAFCMTLVQLKRSAERLTQAEREELAAHLKILSVVTAPGWKEGMSRRMREMDRGKKVTQREFERRIGLRKK